MDIHVLSQAFTNTGVIDQFQSIIWTKRYNRIGDFELKLLMSKSLLDVIKVGGFIALDDPSDLMIIDSLEIKTDVNDGNILTVTGASLESVLSYRIIWEQTILSGNLQTEIERLLNENVIDPEDPERKIENLIFEHNSDPLITSLILNEQHTGENILQVIELICESYDIGFKLYINDSGNMVFKLYKGADRSYDQDTNSYVVFSTNFENIMDTRFVITNKNYKNVTLVAGEGEGYDRKTIVVQLDDEMPRGLERREMYTDARDISQTVDGGSLSDSVYYNLLGERGVVSLYQNTTETGFDGELDATQLYIYGRDFFMGDIVQTENEFGITGKSAITEIIRSETQDGTRIYPTFKAL